MSTLERVFVRVLMAAVAVVCLGGAVWGPSRMVQVLLGAGLPQASEAVPRQIPYRGYVEQNGTPLTSAGVPMRFRLYGVDGGFLHEETQNAVVVQQGHFSVELGDGTPIAPDTMRQNFLELEVGIGSPPQVLQGRQRILSVPFSQSAATGVPAGTVVSFAGEAVPAGWLLCNGAVISETLYPSLCAVLGASWGPAGAGQCKLPDLRGQFLRGAHGVGTDPDGDRAVGTMQSHALGNHGHTVTQNPHSHGLNFLAGNDQGNGLGHPRAPGGQGFGVNVTTLGASADISVDSAGGAETRPTNVGIQFIIRQ